MFLVDFNSNDERRAPVNIENDIYRTSSPITLRNHLKRDHPANSFGQYYYCVLILSRLVLFTLMMCIVSCSKLNPAASDFQVIRDGLKSADSSKVSSVFCGSPYPMQDNALFGDLRLVLGSAPVFVRRESLPQLPEIEFDVVEISEGEFRAVFRGHCGGQSAYLVSAPTSDSDVSPLIQQYPLQEWRLKYLLKQYAMMQIHLRDYQRARDIVESVSRIIDYEDAMELEAFALIGLKQGEAAYSVAEPVKDKIPRRSWEWIVQNLPEVAPKYSIVRDAPETTHLSFVELEIDVKEPLFFHINDGSFVKFDVGRHRQKVRIRPGDNIIKTCAKKYEFGTWCDETIRETSNARFSKTADDFIVDKNTGLSWTARAQMLPFRSYVKERSWGFVNIDARSVVKQVETAKAAELGYEVRIPTIEEILVLLDADNIGFDPSEMGFHTNARFGNGAAMHSFCSDHFAVYTASYVPAFRRNIPANEVTGFRNYTQCVNVKKGKISSPLMAGTGEHFKPTAMTRAGEWLTEWHNGSFPDSVIPLNSNYFLIVRPPE